MVLRPCPIWLLEKHVQKGKVTSGHLAHENGYIVSTSLTPTMPASLPQLRRDVEDAGKAHQGLVLPLHVMRDGRLPCILVCTTGVLVKWNNERST